MSQPTLDRGRLTLLATGVSRSFMFNPTELSDEKGVNWGTLDIPGASHPVFQFGSGGDRIISFELYLDGDRGRYGRAEFPPSEYMDLSVQSEINFYRSLVYPRQYDSQDFASVYPHIVALSLGQQYKAVPCIMKSPPTVKIFYWTPKMEPVRATVSIGLSEVSSKSQTAEEIMGSQVQIKQGIIELEEITITANQKRKMLRLPVTHIEGRVPSRVISLPSTTIAARTELDPVTISASRQPTPMGPPRPVGPPRPPPQPVKPMGPPRFTGPPRPPASQVGGVSSRAVAASTAGRARTGATGSWATPVRGQGGRFGGSGATSNFQRGTSSFTRGSKFTVMPRSTPGSTPSRRK